jgi:hypothetical protein
MERSSQWAIRCRKAPQGAIGQDPCLQVDVDAPVSWEQRLSPVMLLYLLFYCLSCHANWSPNPVFITDVFPSVLKSFHPLYTLP